VERHAAHRYEYGQDIGVAALCYLSWAMWQLGYVGLGSAMAAEAITGAEKLSHPHTLAYAICHARGFMDVFRGSRDDIQVDAGRAISLCTENGFSHWLNCARILAGCAEINRGDLDSGLQTLEAGIAGWRERGARLWLPFFQMLLAEGYSKANRSEAALKAIDEALTVCEETSERWAMAEVLRVKARLLQESGEVKTDEIEAILIQALELARSQQARCWELRTSCDLARLWKTRGRTQKGLTLLKSIYGQFVEGLDTADLHEAKTLMDSLKQGTGRSRFVRRRRAIGKTLEGAEIEFPADDAPGVRQHPSSH
jgi:predicted ATPase